MPTEQSDIARLIADHLAGDEDASSKLAALVERDASARAQVALHLMIDRSLTQLGAECIDVAQIMRALPQRRTSTMPSRVLRQIARNESRRRQWSVLPLAAAALLLVSLFVLLMWQPGRSLPSENPLAATPTKTALALALERAILRGSPHAQWPHRTMPVDAAGRVTSELIDLRAGLAELELPSGATMVLQGPTVIQLTGNNSVRLLLGRLTAYVPPRASGFVLQAEGVRVVDLGTAFGISQDSGGKADVHVFSGQVEASARIDGTDTIRRLTTNEAVRIDPRGGSWTTVPCDPTRFIHGLRPRGLSLDLADIVAGGDGFGTAAADGIDPMTGELTTGPSLGIIKGKKSIFQPVQRLYGIDGVFIPDGGQGETVLDSAGNRFQFPDTDGGAYDIIRRGGTYDTPQNGGRPQQPGIPPTFGGVNYRAPGRSALGMHASVGMSIDLQDIAYRHPGLRVDRFSAMLANVGRKGGVGRADFWVLIDGQLIGRYEGLTADKPPIALDISVSATQRYLTLVSTDGGNSNGLDWITLGDPRIHLSEAR